MRKIVSLCLNLFVLFCLVLVPTAQAVLLDLGGGGFYDTSTGMYQNADGSIKSSTSDGFSAAVNTSLNGIVNMNTAPLGEAPSNNCVSGTESVLANGSGQCQAYINSKLTTISYCTGSEISGPCRPERIDAISAATSAANQARATGQSCTAQFVGFPGVDPNTGLSYYYNISCNGGTSSTGTGGSGSSAGTTNQTTTTSSAQNYISSLTSILNSLTASARSVLNTTNPGSVAVLPPLTGNTGSTGSTGTNPPTSCYVFTRNLSIGSTGKDVGALTTQLKKEGFISEVTEVFDTKVLNAVVAFQNAHKTEILTILGLSSGTGIVGTKTLAYLNSICVNYSTGTGTGTGTGQSCTSPVRSGIQNGKYQYTFSKNTNGTWTITLNNGAYSVPSDQYYVQPNYSFIAVGKTDLNRQNQGRFNYLSTLPGTPEGNTEYANLFGSFNNAYYDWENMTKEGSICTSL